MWGIEVPEVAGEELLALDEDIGESDDVIDDEGEMDETDRQNLKNSISKPQDYPGLLTEIKERIHSAQYEALKASTRSWSTCTGTSDG